MNIQKQRIFILDFGSQYTQLIARRIREAGVYCEIHPYDLSAKAIKLAMPSGLIFSGGPETVLETVAPRPDPAIYQLGLPILGVCYGMQVMASQLGGGVSQALQREFGRAQVTCKTPGRLLANIADHENHEGDSVLDVWMSHGDKIEAIPPGFSVIACSEAAPYAGMADENRQLYGLQFHPEVTHTPQGQRLLERFVLEICGCDPLWTPARIIDDAIERIRKEVGKEHVILGVSGGVDSSVTAALLHKAIGPQLHGLFIDNGLLRFDEVQQVRDTLEKHFHIDLIHVDASDTFLKALEGVSDPEKKRQIIGAEFINVFEQQAKQLNGIKWLAQGTIYPDVIESADTKNGKTAVIKSHHNVGGLPENMNLKLVEPLRECFKDEVRKIGLELGLPYDTVYRHPFPGPGLAVRVMGEIKPNYLDLLRQADHIFLEELHKHDYYQKVSQAFAVFLPIRSVGVIGDARQYGYVIALRAVTTTDFMTAEAATLPNELLALVAQRIVNEIRDVSRVVYDLSSKPPATIEWE